MSHFVVILPPSAYLSIGRVLAQTMPRMRMIALVLWCFLTAISAGHEVEGRARRRAERERNALAWLASEPPRMTSR